MYLQRFGGPFNVIYSSSFETRFNFVNLSKSSVCLGGSMGAEGYTLQNAFINGDDGIRDYYLV
jgi:hypothetical protein